MINQQTLTVGKQHIIYDADMSDVKMTAWPYLFEPEFLAQQQRITATAQGRGTTWFFNWESHQLVLRRYLRGGLVGKFNTEYYLKTALKNTRPYREWRVLCELQRLRLPAPRPAAMRIVSGGLFYRADLITHQLSAVTPLCDALQQAELDAVVWEDIGHTLRRFHEHGIYHADLNCHNILLRGSEVFVLDFDKGEIKPNSLPQDSWKQKNLRRLRRSLDKEQGLAESFYFDDSHWAHLQRGYQTL